jgi:hypothetical protein
MTFHSSYIVYNIFTVWQTFNNRQLIVNLHMTFLQWVGSYNRFIVQGPSWEANSYFAAQ